MNDAKYSDSVNSLISRRGSILSSLSVVLLPFGQEKDGIKHFLPFWLVALGSALCTGIPIDVIGVQMYRPIIGSTHTLDSSGYMLK